MKLRIAMKTLRWACFCAALGMGTHGWAQQVYKCTSVSGRIGYADAPCARSDTASKVSIQPNALDAVDPRVVALRDEAELRRQQPRIAQPGPTAPPEVAHAAAVDQSPLARIDSLGCQRAKRDYEVTASSSANTSAIIEAKRSMMYGACGQREPDVHQTVVFQRRALAPLRGGAYAVFP